MSRPIRIPAAALAISLLWAACSTAGTEQPKRVEAGQPFSLAVGASAQVGSSELRVGFDGVANDSRCPKGTQCVWAGEATLRVWLRQGSGAKQALDLRAGAGPAPAARALGHELRLVRLDPYPVASKPVANDGYVATLVVNPQTPAAPDR